MSTCKKHVLRAVSWLLCYELALDSLARITVNQPGVNLLFYDFLDAGCRVQTACFKVSQWFMLASRIFSLQSILEQGMCQSQSYMVADTGLSYDKRNAFRPLLEDLQCVWPSVIPYRQMALKYNAYGRLTGKYEHLCIPVNSTEWNFEIKWLWIVNHELTNITQARVLLHWISAWL